MEVLRVEWTYPYPMGPERNTDRFVYMRPDRRACSLEKIMSFCVLFYFVSGVVHSLARIPHGQHEISSGNHGGFENAQQDSKRDDGRETTAVRRGDEDDAPYCQTLV